MSDSGISTIDMMGMPAPIRRIVRIMLRKNQLSYEGVVEACDNLPEEKRPTREEIDEALEALVAMEWLVRREEPDGSVTYAVKVAKKEGSEVTRTGTRKDRHKSDVMKNLWEAVDEGAAAAEDGRRAQSEMTEMQKEQREASTRATPPSGSAPLNNLLGALTDETDEADSSPTRRDTQPGGVPTQPLPPPSQAEEEEQPEEKLGFFARLFGKKRSSK